MVIETDRLAEKISAFTITVDTEVLSVPNELIAEISTPDLRGIGFSATMEEATYEEWTSRIILYFDPSGDANQSESYAAILISPDEIEESFVYNSITGKARTF